MKRVAMKLQEDLDKPSTEQEKDGGDETKLVDFEVARDGSEIAPRRSPGVGAPVTLTLQNMLGAKKDKHKGSRARGKAQAGSEREEGQFGMATARVC